MARTFLLRSIARSRYLGKGNCVGSTIGTKDYAGTSLIPHRQQNDVYNKQGMMRLIWRAEIQESMPYGTVKGK